MFQTHHRPALGRAAVPECLLTEQDRQRGFTTICSPFADFAARVWPVAVPTGDGCAIANPRPVGAVAVTRALSAGAGVGLPSWTVMSTYPDHVTTERKE
jgi:hypothetical protein